MPEPKLRSTSSKKRTRSTVTRIVTFTKAKKPSAATCALCGKTLAGVPRRGVHDKSKLSRTQKRPQRPFGGVLCANCTETVIKTKTRLELGAISKSDVDLRHAKYVDALKMK